MRKFFLLFICLIVISIPVFADSFSPVILPVYTSSDLMYRVDFSSGGYRSYASLPDNSSAVYFSYAVSGTDSDPFLRQLLVSEAPFQFILNRNGTLTTVTASEYVDGYYVFSLGIGSRVSELVSSPPVFYSVGSSDSEIISSALSSIPRGFSGILSVLVGGSLSWLKLISDAVLTDSLLLLFVLFGFVGIAIGLLFRFRRY